MKMVQQILYRIPILIIGMVLSSCYYDQVIPVDPVVEGDVSFSSDIILIFNKDCNMSGCHNTGGKAPDLTAGNAYSALINGDYINTGDPEGSELYQWMRGNKGLPMPLSGPNATYNATVLAWIQQGALNN